LEISQFKGSWAGAFVVEFIPTTFLKFAVDWDRDKKIDLWHNPKIFWLQLPIFRPWDGIKY
jgi:membrane-bound lytic murein transglycosylase B